jgi:hypothetical protein
MTVQEMSQRILATIDRAGDATMVELQSAVGDESKGEYSFEFAPNVVMWAGMSEMFLAALQSLRPVIEPHPSSVLCYLYDGGTLRLPLAKRPTRKGYKTPHWTPVTFRRRQK